MSETTMTEAAWRARGESLFGPDIAKWRFKCPSCGHVATPADWKDAGAPESAIAFSCVGRWADDDKVADRAFRQNGGPCNYTGGGLFKLNPIVVKTLDGAEASVFGFDEPNAAVPA